MSINIEKPKGESWSDYKPLVIPLLLGLLPFLGSSLLIYLIKTYPALLQFENIWTTIGIFAAMSIALALGLMHASMASIAMGYYLGWQGLAAFGIPYLIACALGYSVSKLIGSGKFNAFLSVMYPKWEIHAKDAYKNPFVYVFFLRLTPIFPFAITNYLLASLDIKFWKMLVSSAAGQLPRSALFVWVGTLISNWLLWVEEGENLPGNTKYYLYGLGALGLTALYILWKRAEKLSEKESAS